MLNTDPRVTDDMVKKYNLLRQSMPQAQFPNPVDMLDNKDEHKFGREVKGFIEALGLFNVKMNNPKFDYEFYQMEDKKMGNQYEKGLLEECKDKDFEDNIKNILKNRFSAEDLIIYLTETDDISLLYYIDFEIKLDEKEKNKLNKELDEYLDTFIESRLYY